MSGSVGGVPRGQLAWLSEHWQSRRSGLQPNFRGASEEWYAASVAVMNDA